MFPIQQVKLKEERESLRVLVSECSINDSIRVLTQLNIINSNRLFNDFYFDAASNLEIIKNESPQSIR